MNPDSPYHEREETEDKGKKVGFKHSFKDLPSEHWAFVSFKADQL